jgi:trans-2,3-dihydro-3-hydroxyanthranilate isomerase
MTGATLAYEVVDVFAGRAFAGNPLAVVLDGDDLTTAQMQAIAGEFNLSETTFPFAAPEGATYGLRIFTPNTELPFAGHPSVGSAWVLHRLGRIAEGDNIQACGAGLLPVHVGADEVMLTGGTPTCSEPLDAAPVFEALGLESSDLIGVEPRWAGVGIDWGFLLVRPEALATVAPDDRRIAALGGTGISLVAWDGAVARCRVFAGGAGVPEDPATGSAALALGVFLHAAGLLADGEHRYVVEQGYEMGRPSTLRCTITITDGAVTRTTVAGSVVPIARGEITVPPV